MQQRYYDPGIGMFLSVDPVTAYSDPIGQFHRYRYANNNPYKFTDPDGRSPVDDDPNHRPGPIRASPAGNPPPPPSSAPIADNQSQQQSNTGFSATGLLVGKPSVTATGIAAAGSGVQATKGLYNSDSSVGIVTPALALSASVDVEAIGVTYTGSDAPEAPVEVTGGVVVGAHTPLGGARISVGYTPPSTFKGSLELGAGLGFEFHVFEVNAVFDED